ncbi:MAG: DNA mismatch repair protein MutS [Nonlabens sp.]
MNDTLINFYKKREEAFSQEKNRFQQQLRGSSFIRLLVFLGGIAAVYFLWEQWQLTFAVSTAVFILFLILVTRHAAIKKKRDFKQALIDIQQEEMRIGNRDYLHRDDGKRYLDEDHEYGRDIDLFGRGSIFQYLNRSVTPDGVDTLAQKLNSNNITAINKKQKAVQELAGEVDFRQEFSATATLLNNEKSPKQILNWLKQHDPFVSSIFSWLPWAFFALNILLGAAYATDVINGYVFSAGFFIGLGITGRYVKQITSLSNDISQLELFFSQYSQLLSLVERQELKSELLKNLKDQVITSGKPASLRLKKLSEAIGRLDQRNNMLFGILANGFGLWDLKQVHTIEKWLETNKDHIANWLNAVAEIDAMNSLGNFAYNHPNYIYPQIKTGEFQLKVQNAIHPLLDPQKAVGNDIDISSGEFFIITGANMAGKSTFLRTVSSQIVFSNLGLPIYATQAFYAPIKLITSMRTSDSLTDDESYFFSELKRLKYIVDKIETERYFIVLDEILKGTNSQDKANGSRKLIEKLSKKHATGIIATHDLSLTEVADEYYSISNYFFDADITNDELTFDYKFKDGVATNMNASFLLRKMGIVDG